MAKRSGHVCDHSAPAAPEFTRCSQIVHAAATAENTKKGTSAPRSRHVSRRCCHQTQSASTTGSITVEGLLKIARRAQTRAKP